MKKKNKNNNNNNTMKLTSEYLFKTKVKIIQGENIMPLPRETNSRIALFENNSKQLIVTKRRFKNKNAHKNIIQFVFFYSIITF